MCCARVQFVFTYFRWYFVPSLLEVSLFIFLCSYFFLLSLPLALSSLFLSLSLFFYFCLFVIVSCCTQFTFVKFTCSKNVGIRVLYNDRIILMQTTYVVWHECICTCRVTVWWGGVWYFLPFSAVIWSALMQPARTNCSRNEQPTTAYRKVMCVCIQNSSIHCSFVVHCDFSLETYRSEYPKRHSLTTDMMVSVVSVT